jgi:hypothetical protein
VKVELTDYERDNLLAMLVAIWRYGSAPWLNTGDWVGQIPHKLGWNGNETEWGRPNATAEQMAERAAIWQARTSDSTPQR